MDQLISISAAPQFMPGQPGMGMAPMDPNMQQFPGIPQQPGMQNSFFPQQPGMPGQFPGQPGQFQGQDPSQPNPNAPRGAARIGEGVVNIIKGGVGSIVGVGETVINGGRRLGYYMKNKTSNMRAGIANSILKEDMNARQRVMTWQPKPKEQKDGNGNAQNGNGQFGGGQFPGQPQQPFGGQFPGQQQQPFAGGQQFPGQQAMMPMSTSPSTSAAATPGQQPAYPQDYTSQYYQQYYNPYGMGMGMGMRRRVRKRSFPTAWINSVAMSAEPLATRLTSRISRVFNATNSNSTALNATVSNANATNIANTTTVDNSPIFIRTNRNRNRHNNNHIVAESLDNAEPENTVSSAGSPMMPPPPFIPPPMQGPPRQVPMVAPKQGPMPPMPMPMPLPAPAPMFAPKQMPMPPPMQVPMNGPMMPPPVQMPMPMPLPPQPIIAPKQVPMMPPPVQMPMPIPAPMPVKGFSQDGNQKLPFYRGQGAF